MASSPVASINNYERKSCEGVSSAQIDYLVITKKMCFVIECKNLCGNVEITNTGDFIRTTNFGGRKKKEGIYSPITQNQRHLELMKKIKVDIKSNIITKLMIGKYFEDFNKSLVVLVNPKTVINAKYAKKEVKSQVIRADQLVRYIKDFYEKSKDTASSDEKMLAWAKSYLDLHKEKSPINVTISIEKTEIFKELKAYRLAKSREENIKPYFIYNDNQLKDLIFKMPRSEEELIKVDGFGKVKADKYGDDIFKIVNKY